MTTSIRSLCAVCVLTIGAALPLACSSPGAALLPQTDGWGPAGGGEPGSAHDAGSTPTPPPAPTGTGTTGTPNGGGTGTGKMDAGPVATDAGTGIPPHDAGTGTGNDASAPPSKGPLGSCTNPACGTDTNQCGCSATDSQGNSVQLGCQAGGLCGCFVNQQSVDNGFPENGACTDTASTRSQFLSSCACQ